MTAKTSALRQWRESLGLTLDDVAGAVGIDASTLSRAETGVHGVSLASAQALAAFYGRSIDELLRAVPPRAQ